MLATIDGMSDEETTNFLSANVRDLFLIMCWDPTKVSPRIVITC